jgi:Flp pilus assembly protein TadG
MRASRQFHHKEAGQTIVLVAISIFSLLAMATLAIDVVSLYVARNEIQRAADAAALVGAKALADSGVTTLQPGDTNAGAAVNMAQSMANSAITALISSPGFNQVAGGPVSLVGTPTITYQGGNNLTNNPTISVTLQRTGLPIFFARIIGGSASTTAATAVAEAYNPANVQSFTPIAPRCVKPWLVANADPTQAGTPPFVDTNTWLARDAVGESFYLNGDCDPTNGSGCSAHLHNGPPQAYHATPPVVEFLPALVTPGAPTMYSSCAGGSDYERSIAGCDVTNYSYYQCGNTSTAATTSWDPAIDPNPKHGGENSATALATECLIHARGLTGGQGQDIISVTPWTNPPQVTAQSGPKSGSIVSTSDSVVTIPIVDVPPNIINPPYTVTIVGYLHAFVNQVDDLGNKQNDAIYVTVLNVVGCSNTPNSNPAIIGGNGTSAIPVRLITPQ